MRHELDWSDLGFSEFYHGNTAMRDKLTSCIV